MLSNILSINCTISQTSDKKSKSFSKYNLFQKGSKKFPIPGIEPGPSGWKPDILATRPYGIFISYFNIEIQ